ncbi:unnamed protein product [Aphanomyces euteiches]
MGILYPDVTIDPEAGNDGGKKYPTQATFWLVQERIDDDMGINFVMRTSPVAHCSIVIEPYSQAAAVGMVTGMRISGLKGSRKVQMTPLELNERPLLKDCTQKYSRLLIFDPTLVYLKEKRDFRALSAYKSRSQRVFPVRADVKARLEKDVRARLIKDDPLEITRQTNLECLKKLDRIRHGRQRTRRACSIRVVTAENGDRAEEISKSIAAKRLQGDELEEAKKVLDAAVLHKAPTKRQRKAIIDEIALRRARAKN